MLRNKVVVVHFALGIVASAQECNLRGQCSGAQEVGADLKSTYENCQNVCRLTSHCRYFTFYASSQLCLLFTDCPSIDTTHCDDCASSDVSCPPVGSRTCDHVGKCRGLDISATGQEDSARKCLRSCQRRPGCAWWNFDDNDLTCQLLSTCQVVDTIASDPQVAGFVYGTRDCDQYGFRHSNRLITLGGLKSDRHGTRAVNALNLVDSPLDSQDCDYVIGIPEEDFGNVGALIDGRLTICGGDDGERYCYQQNSTKETWQRTPASLSSISIRGSSVAFDEDNWIIFMGANQYDQPSNGINLYSSADTIVKLTTTLPYGDGGASSHCTVRLSDTEAFIVGGQGYKGEPEYADAVIFTFDPEFPNLSSWEAMPPMTTPRAAPFCGLVKDYLDRPGNDVVVVGGGGKGLVNSTEIFSLKERTWSPGPEMPEFGLCCGASVAYEGSFLTVGGKRGRESSSTAYVTNRILRFDGIRGKWIETDWKLESALAYLVGFVGPDEKFNCEAQVGN